jgi:hypothetical protein
MYLLISFRRIVDVYYPVVVYGYLPIVASSVKGFLSLEFPITAE